LILSKYDSDADVYQRYEFVGDEVTFDKSYKFAQTDIPIIHWTQTVEEICWSSKDRYIKFLKNKGFREEKKNDVHSKSGQAV
jgi:hypothetical protein